MNAEGRPPLQQFMTWPWRDATPVAWRLADLLRSEIAEAACLTPKDVAELVPSEASKRLRFLTINDGRVDDDALESAAQLVNLEALSIWELYAESLEAISRLRMLKWLEIRQLSRALALTSFMPVPRLETLVLGLNAKIRSLEGLDGSNFPHLNTLELLSSSKTRILHLESLKPLASISTLRSLTLLGVVDDKDALSAFADHPNLDTLFLYRSATWNEAHIGRLADSGVDVKLF